MTEKIIQPKCPKCGHEMLRALHFTAYYHVSLYSTRPYPEEPNRVEWDYDTHEIKAEVPCGDTCLADTGSVPDPWWECVECGSTYPDYTFDIDDPNNRMEVTP